MDYFVIDLSDIRSGKWNGADTFKCFIILIMIPNEEALLFEVWGKKIHRASHHRTQKWWKKRKSALVSS